MSTLELPPANQLRELRLAKGLTQEQLSQISGVHPINISKIENGRLPLSGRTLMRLSLALDVDPRELLGIRKKSA